MNRALSRLVVVSAFVISGCAGGSVDVDAAGAIVEATPLVTATPMPTSVEDVVGESTVVSVPPEVVVEFSDGELIEAALLALDVDGVESLFAWDVLESSVGSGGVVSLVLCGWTGETVFDGVYESLWSTEVSDAGSLSARELGTSVTAGECLNSELIDSALAFTREYDDFYREVAAAPETFAGDPRSHVLLIEREVAVVGAAMQAWVDDGMYARATSYSGGLPDSAVGPVSYRRFQGVEVGVLELVACREIGRDHGLYRGDVLIDDFSGGVHSGPHAVTKYSLRRDRSAGIWRLSATEAVVWTDCFAVDDWLEAVNEWRPEPAVWMLVPKGRS